MGVVLLALIAILGSVAVGTLAASSIPGHSIANVACSGQFVLVLKSSIGESDYEEDLAPVLNSTDGAEYLRTDQSCGSFTQQSAGGEPIYAAYLGPFSSRKQALSQCDSAPRDAYVKQLVDGGKKIWRCRDHSS